VDRLMTRYYDGEDSRVIDVFTKWIDVYGSEDFKEENLILFNMFLSDLDSKGGMDLFVKLNIRNNNVFLLRNERNHRKVKENDHRQAKQWGETEPA